MTLPISFTADAENDVLSAAEFYEQQCLGLGFRFLNQLQKAEAMLAEWPDMFPILHSSVRKAVLPNFPFAVIYRVEEDRIVVLAIWHTSRNPDELGRRL